MKFNVLKSLDDKKPSYIAPDLEKDELAAIGFVVTQWAMLEHRILDATLDRLPEEGDAKIIKKACALSLSQRMEAWKDAIEKYCADREERARLIALHERVATLSRARHEVAHGLWEWEDGDPAKLTAYSLRPGRESELSFDFKSLVDLAIQIGQTTFLLRYPGGNKQVDEERLKHLQETGFSVSRAFLKSIIAEESEHASDQLDKKESK